MTVSVADDGDVALRMLIDSYEDADASPYDLCLMDIQMPRLDGLQATKRFRAFERQHRPEHHLPVVALSANVFDEAINECTDAGMDGARARPVGRCACRRVRALMLACCNACAGDRLCAQAAASGHAARRTGVAADVLSRQTIQIRTLRIRTLRCFACCLGFTQRQLSLTARAPCAYPKQLSCAPPRLRRRGRARQQLQRHHDREPRAVPGRRLQRHRAAVRFHEALTDVEPCVACTDASAHRRRCHCCSALSTSPYSMACAAHPGRCRRPCGWATCNTAQRRACSPPRTCRARRPPPPASARRRRPRQARSAQRWSLRTQEKADICVSSELAAAHRERAHVPSVPSANFDASAKA